MSPFPADFGCRRGPRPPQIRHLTFESMTAPRWVHQNADSLGANGTAVQFCHSGHYPLCAGGFRNSFCRPVQPSAANVRIPTEFLCGRTVVRSLWEQNPIRRCRQGRRLGLGIACIRYSHRSKHLSTARNSNYSQSAAKPLHRRSAACPVEVCRIPLAPPLWLALGAKFIRLLCRLRRLGKGALWLTDGDGC